MKANVGLKVWCVLAGLVLAGVSSTRADYWASRSPGPGGRVAHSIVSIAGGDIIVWGGGAHNTWLNDGARYNLATDSWTPISNDHGLAGRWWHVAVWTGKEMIVWGGRGAFFPEEHRGDGALYNPVTGTWRRMSSAGAPAARSQLTAVWTGTEMIVWGGTGDGFEAYGDGARYNPETDTWTPLPAAPLEARFQQTAIWSGSEMIIFGGLKIEDFPDNEHWSSFGDGAKYNPASNTWTPLNSHGAPSSRTAHSAVWTGTEMIVWGGRYLPDYVFLDSGASYDPVRDSWMDLPRAGAPEARMEHAAVWSGTEMIIWGGFVDPSPAESDTGARYNPVSRVWTPTTHEGAPQARFFGGTIYGLWTGNALFIYGGWEYPVELNSTALYYPTGGPVIPPHTDFWERLPDGPGGRAYHSTVFTGDEVIVWGGGRDGSFLNDGAVFDLESKRWDTVSSRDAPSGRWFHAAVWTGEEMIVWGGRANFFAFNHSTDGGRYDPKRDRWTGMSELNAPSPRSQFTTIWTGREMIVWGGMGDGATELSDGGRYDPETDSWTRLAASPLEPRFEPTAVWTGTEMIVFGGLKIDNYLGREHWSSFGDGARYNPRTGHWRLLNPAGAPSSRTVHTAVWTGTEMLIWGGRYLPDQTYPTTGAGYDPATDSWTPMSTIGAPRGRAGHAAVWTGKEMIVWGGWSDPGNAELNTGGSYNPVSQVWTPTTLIQAPQTRFFNVPNPAVWTGKAMFIYGGFDYPVSLNSAHLYYLASPTRMLEELIRLLHSLDLPRKAERPLEASLDAALESLERGHENSAASQLEAFQRKVRSQLGDSELAQTLIDAAQAIIDHLDREQEED